MFRLLLVDGDPDSRLVVTHALRRRRMFEVVGEASDAGTAISLASSLAPDIVLLDLHLRDKDGLWALPRIREGAPAAQVVLRSAFPVSELRFAAFAGGAVGYLEKGRSPLTLSNDLLGICGFLDVIQLLVSETVTNAILHARSEVQVSVALAGDRVRVSVFDGSTRGVVRRPALPESTSGRGVAMLDALSSGWGVQFTPRGKCVWFDVRAPMD